MTFWSVVATIAVPDLEPAGVGAGRHPGQHGALGPCPVELTWLRSLDEAVPAMLDGLRDDTTDISPADQDRALCECAAFSTVPGDPALGGAPAYNLLPTRTVRSAPTSSSSRTDRRSGT